MEKSPNKYMQDKKIYKLSPNLIIENNNNNTFKYTSTSSRVFQTFSSIEKKEKNRNLSPLHQIEKEISEYNENISKLKQKFNNKKRTNSKNNIEIQKYKNLEYNKEHKKMIIESILDKYTYIYVKEKDEIKKDKKEDYQFQIEEGVKIQINRTKNNKKVNIIKDQNKEINKE